MLVRLLALVVAVHANDGLDIAVSLKGKHVKLSKSEQLGEWLELKDEMYNKKGFYQWKSQKEGFVMKNKDSNEVSCHVKSNAHSEFELKVGFDCNMIEKEKSTAETSAADASARFRSKLKTAGKFTPLQYPKLQPLDPNVAKSALGSHGASGNKAVKLPTAEGDLRVEHREQQELDQVDLGKISTPYDPSNTWVANKAMKNAPYVDAGVDREVNERMFDFFKQHPQYHSPEANWRAARLWKHEISAGQGGRGVSDADGESMWGANSCNMLKKVPVGWPDVPDVQCETYAISPMGYWGCKWLFEDGTCGNIQFYPTIRWDGLDAYRTKNHDPEDAEIEQNGAFPATHGH